MMDQLPDQKRELAALDRPTIRPWTRLTLPYLERAGCIIGRLKPEGFTYLASLVPLFNTSVDRLDQVPARLRQLFQFSAAAALQDPMIRGEVSEGPAHRNVPRLDGFEPGACPKITHCCDGRDVHQLE